MLNICLLDHILALLMELGSDDFVKACCSENGERKEARAMQPLASS